MLTLKNNMVAILQAATAYTNIERVNNQLMYYMLRFNSG